MQDIAPELLERIRQEFLSLLGEASEAPTDYAGAMRYAERVGNALAEALRRHLSANLLPDGRMYWNIADRVLRPLLEEDHALVSAAAQAAQQALNAAAGIGIKAQAAPLDTSRVEGILNAVSSAEQYEDAAWLLAEPVRTFSRAVVDETLRRNVEFQGKAGLRPKVIRKAESHCCEWCSRLAGSYEYPDVPKDVYRRHSRCRCRVEYDPGSGKRQNVHTKQWTTEEETAKIEVRKAAGQTRLRQFQTQALLQRHFEKHQAEFGVISIQEYLRKATQLADKPLSEDVVQLVRSDKSISKYCFSTNEFVVITKDGYIRTYFKPNAKEAYWNEELERNK